MLLDLGSMSSMSDDEFDLAPVRVRPARPRPQENTGGYEGLFISEMERFMWTRNPYDIPTKGLALCEPRLLGQS